MLSYLIMVCVTVHLKEAQSRRSQMHVHIYIKWKTLCRPSGYIVPSLKMISISNCSLLKSAPVHFLKPLTAMSNRVCLGELRCSATGKPWLFFWTLWRCSPNRSCRVRLVFQCVAGGIDVKRCCTLRFLIWRWSPHGWWLNSLVNIHGPWPWCTGKCGSVGVDMCSPANQRRWCIASLAIDASSYTLGKLVVPYANDLLKNLSLGPC